MTKVELVSRTEGVGLYDGLSSGEMVEAVARHGVKKDYGRLIRYLIKYKHWSPLEHVHFTFRIETARDVSAQMMRHRSFHWQELSQRYDVIQEFMPVELRKQGETNRQSSTEIYEGGDILVDTALDIVKSAYEELLKRGVARECARRILPMCAKTTVHMTGNLRDFLGYLNVRCEAGTQKEHREVALAIGREIQKEFPELKNIDWSVGNFM
jgi:thymidylate synthase (FAD)